MVNEQIVWNEVWPTVEKLIAATLEEDGTTIESLLVSDEQAHQMMAFFGFQVFDVLLKTVLGRGNLAVTRAIETENGRFVHIEYTWPEPGAEPNSYTAADIVSVTLTQVDNTWKIVDVNPSTTDLPLTEPRARGVLASTQAAVRKNYEINLSLMVPRIKKIKKTLKIQGQDERFSDLQPTRIVFDHPAGGTANE